MATLKEICSGLPLNPLPTKRDLDNSVPHAPIRTPALTKHDRKVTQDAPMVTYLDKRFKPVIERLIVKCKWLLYSL